MGERSGHARLALLQLWMGRSHPVVGVWWAICPFVVIFGVAAADHRIVEQNAKSGSYREVLDWLAAQVDRLDQHERELERQCVAGELDASAVETRTAQITEARNWLAAQLENALVARGLSLAA